jgi:hypothetical protein
MYAGWTVAGFQFSRSTSVGRAASIVQRLEPWSSIMSISEFTDVDAVRPFYDAFLKAFRLSGPATKPTAISCITASQNDGYKRRLRLSRRPVT